MWTIYGLSKPKGIYTVRVYECLCVSLQSGRKWQPAEKEDRLANASMQTLSDKYILDLFYAELRDQILEQPTI